MRLQLSQSTPLHEVVRMLEERSCGARVHCIKSPGGTTSFPADNRQATVFDLDLKEGIFEAHYIMGPATFALEVSVGVRKVIIKAKPCTDLAKVAEAVLRKIGMPHGHIVAFECEEAETRAPLTKTVHDLVGGLLHDDVEVHAVLAKEEPASSCTGEAEGRPKRHRLA